MKKFIRTFLQYTDLSEQGRNVAMLWDNKENRYIVIGVATYAKIHLDPLTVIQRRYETILLNFSYDGNN